ncbi:bifunctional metallophosphatase/5'-nucleotidase [Flavihumibacter sp. R14]|nr:bifunctional metallophosphatase/5'-nucleotidase [Flavihumibacter soli]
MSKHNSLHFFRLCTSFTNAKFSFTLLLPVLLSLNSCKTLKTPPPGGNDDGRITVNYLLVNDVYEIAPLGGGAVGGMARVATLKKESLRFNPNTYLIMAGDFLSPSVFNSLQYDGKRIRGRQMVETMNAAGMDLAVFGNHEFDINEPELQARINESTFRWVASNTFHKKNPAIVPFAKETSSGEEPFAETWIQSVTDADGTRARIGYIGLTLPFNKAPYVSYTDPLATAEKLYKQLEDSCDAIIAVTHQLVEDDILLAKRLPGLAMILGGHEHDMRMEKVGSVYVLKAHANARSVYSAELLIDKKRKRLKVKPELKMIDTTVADDKATAAVVEKWTDIANNSYAAIGFDPSKVVLKNSEPLDGRESEIRKQATNMSRLIIAAMEAAAPEAEVSLMNAGSIRVDDILPMPVTEYDILRAMPFGGGILLADIKGGLLIQTLEAGRKNSGIGGFLHYSEALKYDPAAGTWLLQGTAIDPGRTYRVALPEFLLSGGEANMDFLKKENPDVLKVYPYVANPSDLRSDIRLAIVKYLEKK